MSKDDILFTILNYKEKVNSEHLYNRVSPYFKCHILDADSGELPHSFDGDTIYMPNVYFGGLLDKAIRLSIDGNYKFLFFICSDVMIDDDNCSKLMKILQEEDFSDIAIYCPSHSLQSYTFVQWAYYQSSFSKREVPCIEAMISMWNIEIIKHLNSCKDNKFGWGLDIVAAFYAKQIGKNIYIDDRVQIYHPKGPTSKNDAAGECALNYINQLPEAEQIRQYWHWIYVFRKNKSANVLLMKNYQKWCMLCYKMCKHLPFLKFYKF